MCAMIAADQAQAKEKTMPNLTLTAPDGARITVRGRLSFLDVRELRFRLPKGYALTWGRS